MRNSRFIQFCISFAAVVAVPYHVGRQRDDDGQNRTIEINDCKECF